MLASPGLRDDPPLAHPQRQEALAERVVDLMGTGVTQVFPLEVDLRTARQFREAASKEQGGGAADERREEPVEFIMERRIGHRLRIRLLELVEGRRKRLRHIPAAKPTETAKGIWHGRERNGRRNGRHRKSAWWGMHPRICGRW